MALLLNRCLDRLRLASPRRTLLHHMSWQANHKRPCAVTGVAVLAKGEVRRGDARQGSKFALLENGPGTRWAESRGNGVAPDPASQEVESERGLRAKIAWRVGGVRSQKKGGWVLEQ